MTPARPATGWAASLRRELALLRRDRAAWVGCLALLLLSALAVGAGLLEVRHQHTTMARLVQADQADRLAVQQSQRDWGSLAYYSFHLAADPPSPLAFAALGQRDESAWKHRVRMLALEGQIHERDAGHPELALIGRFDFAFLAAFVMPLVLIVLLHDLHASERAAGRHDLLVVTAANPAALWRLRWGLRAGAVFGATVVPLLAGAVWSGAAGLTLLAATGLVLLHLVFWAWVCARVARWRHSGEVLLAALLGLWILLGVLVPAAGRLAIDRWVPLPSGADILMTQREAVNDAWDLPKAATMSAFVERHPQWAALAAVERPFEWKWYYAFQQVGDQKTEPLTQAYRAGRERRDRLAGRLALVAPPVALQRALQGLAGTDLRATLAYEDRLRAFHAELRAFYYPKLFRDEPFDPAALQRLPRFALTPTR